MSHPNIPLGFMQNNGGKFDPAGSPTPKSTWTLATLVGCGIGNLLMVNGWEPNDFCEFLVHF